MPVLWSKHCLLFAQCYAWFTHRSQYALCSTDWQAFVKSMLLFLFKAERMALGQYCGLSIASYLHSVMHGLPTDRNTRCVLRTGKHL
ncbi:uncharacterized protein B0P05DRAFT_542625 [Gilbertella persicaria]|uniref:uncharacterized protein n=1 Tax=Gilbertella persicaria TaxID=101096 RepID=UPI00221E5F74|nr:uncharacterized protein B0P05DRAFT_542625 [Gilbertella persicaria]KAI8078130.1 hypothetical protein B0P05DRAFT_542625 [Gilbertella persicaria]